MGTNAKLRCREVSWIGHANCKLCSRPDGVLFAGLSNEVLDHLLVPVDQLGLGAKSTLYVQGETAHYLFTVREGLIKLVQDAPSGGPRIVRVLGPGSLVGMEAITGEAYRHTAEVVVPTKVCRIPRETLKDVAGKEPKLYGQLLQIAQHTLDQADEVITSLSTGAAQGRVARLLLNTLSEPGSNTCVSLSREDMSALLSVTVETVSRIVAEFKRQGLIKEQHGQMEFDREGLSQAATL